MKKLISILSAVVLSVALLASCKCVSDSVVDDLKYDLTATASGVVDFSWFNGGASIQGDAKVFQSNDTTEVCKAVPAISLEEGLTCNDPQVAEAATVVSSFVEGVITDVKGVKGEYQLGLTGYVAYGRIVFAIDEHWPPIN